MIPLTLANAGEENTIKRISGRDQVKKHLENLGFVTGADIIIVSELAGNLIVNVKGTRVAISREMAAKIMV